MKLVNMLSKAFSSIKQYEAITRTKTTVNILL